MRRLPESLAYLLNGASPPEKDRAWERFLEEHHSILLRVARTATRDHDGAMDAYTHVLEGLREEDFRRLRVFEADGRSSFRTWLVVVARRLCHDFFRTRYGRSRTSQRSDELRARARLVDLVGAAVEMETLPGRDATPELEVREAELREALTAALGRLPEADRLLLVWRFEDGLPVREIKELVDAPTVFHVYRRLKAVLRDLREELVRRGVEDPRP